VTVFRLRVNIFDTDRRQFTVPESVLTRPPPTSMSSVKSSDLKFNYDPSPFAFWITRRSYPTSMPLFDTRITSLPKTPTQPVNSTDNSTALLGFPLVFENQYLQVIGPLYCPLSYSSVFVLACIGTTSGYKYIWFGRGCRKQRLPARYRRKWRSRNHPDTVGSGHRRPH
jgi:alpha-glucosidase